MLLLDAVTDNFCGTKSKEDEEPVKVREKFKRNPGHAVAGANMLINPGGWWV